MGTLIDCRVRGGEASQFTVGGDSPASITRGGELLTLNGLPLKTEAVRLGNYWSTMIPTGSAFTNVAGMPTTRAELLLRNGEQANGKSYIIDTISFLSLTSVTAAASAAIIYQVNSSALTDDTAVLINSPLGDTYNGLATRDLALTTMVANKWTVAGVANGGAAASIGFGFVAEVNGGIILRPGYTLGVNAVVGTATGTSLMGITWIEAVI